MSVLMVNEKLLKLSVEKQKLVPVESVNFNNKERVDKIKASTKFGSLVESSLS